MGIISDSNHQILSVGGSEPFTGVVTDSNLSGKGTSTEPLGINDSFYITNWDEPNSAIKQVNFDQHNGLNISYGKSAGDSISYNFGTSGLSSTYSSGVNRNPRYVFSVGDDVKLEKTVGNFTQIASLFDAWNHGWSHERVLSSNSANWNNAAHVTGNETINGTKTFTNTINGTAKYADIAYGIYFPNIFSCFKRFHRDDEEIVLPPHEPVYINLYRNEVWPPQPIDYSMFLNGWIDITTTNTALRQLDAVSCTVVATNQDDEEVGLSNGLGFFFPSNANDDYIARVGFTWEANTNADTLRDFKLKFYSTIVNADVSINHVGYSMMGIPTKF